MAEKELPPVELLHKILRYEPETGKLFWRHRPVEMFSDGKFSAERAAAMWNGRFAGKEAFTAKTADGYPNGRFAGVTYRAHRVVWAMCKGKPPMRHIDHINGDRADNRIKNLRDVSNHENTKNRFRRQDNTSGAVGVVWKKQAQKWTAKIGVAGKTLHLGYFESFEAAQAARQTAEVEHGFHANHGRTA